MNAQPACILTYLDIAAIRPRVLLSPEGNPATTALKQVRCHVNTSKLRFLIPTICILSSLSWVTPTLAARSHHKVHANKPSISTLLNKVYQTETQLGSAHGTGTSKLTTRLGSAHGAQTMSAQATFQGDASTTSTPHGKVSEQIAVQGGSNPQNLGLQYIALGPQVATLRTGVSGWQCGNDNLLQSIPAWTPTSFQTKLNPQFHAWIAGSTRFHGTPAWVIDSSNQTAGSKGRQSLTQLVVDKKRYVVLNVSTSTTYTRSGQWVHEATSLSLTSYGEALHAGLPRVCTQRL
jgi:hypothetical protein